MAETWISYLQATVSRSESSRFMRLGCDVMRKHTTTQGTFPNVGVKPMTSQNQ